MLFHHFVSAHQQQPGKTTMRVKLTDSAIRSYQPRDNQYVVGDSSCPGLCIRITPNGVKSFVFTYRNKAARKVICFTIGRYPDVALTFAREIANDARKTAANGGTPLAPRAGSAGGGGAEKKLRPTPKSSSFTKRSV